MCLEHKKVSLHQISLKKTYLCIRKIKIPKTWIFEFFILFYKNQKTWKKITDIFINSVFLFLNKITYICSYKREANITNIHTYVHIICCKYINKTHYELFLCNFQIDNLFLWTSCDLSSCDDSINLTFFPLF